jgi:hypothetical protein
MAFGKVDHVINHVSGERKAITNIDLDKEYGKKGYSITKSNEDVNKLLIEYRDYCINTILAMQPFIASQHYPQSLLQVIPLSWNKDFLNSCTTTFIGSMRAHLERIAESNNNPLNNF